MNLVEQNGGIVSIKEAKEILGAQVYERCWKEIKDSEDWDHFCEKGDRVPTHVCTSDWFFDWFCDKVDSAFESVGIRNTEPTHERFDGALMFTIFKFFRSILKSLRNPFSETCISLDTGEVLEDKN